MPTFSSLCLLCDSGVECPLLASDSMVSIRGIDLTGPADALNYDTWHPWNSSQTSRSRCSLPAWSTDQPVTLVFDSDSGWSSIVHSSLNRLRFLQLDFYALLCTKRETIGKFYKIYTKLYIIFYRRSFLLILFLKVWFCVRIRKFSDVIQCLTKVFEHRWKLFTRTILVERRFEFRH